MTQEPSNKPRHPLHDLSPKLLELTEDVLFGDIWERPTLSKRERSLITVAALVATYRPIQLDGHIERALNNGVSKDQLIELMTHLAFYAGWPAAFSAVEVAEKTFKRLNQA
ncbi:carboxymuconolactone decarboxylase family protein [Mesorhizobium sp.]|uniref:carboxymuconolactone decarboxylase family protein n=1 Tax=Mesorhizobium sp. TaxID=1871066 RepID=UPI0025BB751C|nr:carboxymuconolactone decarboxylase family protein [Mesorhizobium sp.]